MGGTASGATASGAPASTHHGRLEFLDALRGIAVVVVAAQHFSLWPGALRFTTSTFRAGEFGVVVFFLCSGYIIPAALERHGSLPRFWIGRLFRLWPAYLAALTGAILLHALGRFPWDPRLSAHPAGTIAANATMAQHLLDQPLVLYQSWTLGYELVFYLLASLVFVAGLQRRTPHLAIALLLLALVAGNSLTPFALSRQDGSSRLVGVLATLLVAGLAAAAARTARARLIAAALAVLVVPLVLNRPEPFSFAPVMLATLLVGASLHRATAGATSRRRIAALYGGAVAAIVVTEWWHEVPLLEPLTGATTNWRAEALTFTAAYVLFGAAWLLRGRQFPRPLLWLGTISYSVYLVHPLVLRAVPQWGDHRAWSALTWMAVTIVVGALSYRWIERPGIELGRRVAARRVLSHAVATDDDGGRRREHLGVVPGIVLVGDDVGPAAGLERRMPEERTADR